MQKSADEIHYGNAHAGIHVTIHRINPVSDFFIKSYQTVASPLLRTSKRLQSIQRLLQQGKMKLFSEKERIYPTMTGKYPISVFFPISKKDEFGETLGLLLCAKNQQPFSEMDLGCAKMTAAAISRYIQQNYERKVT